MVETFDREIGAPGAPIDDVVIQECDGLISVHTAYYMSASEHHGMLNKLKGTALHRALVHKFPLDVNNGTINNGEQEWTRKPAHGDTYSITQTNIETARTYNHPDNSWMFGNSWSDGTNALALDQTKVCDDLWIVTMRICPAAITHREQASVDHGHNVSPGHAHPVNSKEFIALEGYAMLAHPDLEALPERLAISRHMAPVFEKMRMRCVGKARTAAQYKDHVSFCRNALATAAKAADVTFSVREYFDLCRGSFWVDMRDQVEADKTLFDDNYLLGLTADTVYTHGGQGTSKKVVTTFLDFGVAFTGKNKAAIINNLATALKRTLR